MSQRIVFILAALLIFTVSCGKKNTEVLPRDAYSSSTQGAVMRSAPDGKSKRISVIPFAEKIVLAESSAGKAKPGKEGIKWYRTEWNGEKGWVDGSSAGNIQSVLDEIKKTLVRQKKNFTADFMKKFESPSLEISSIYRYPGGEMEPSAMLFLSNGIMVVNSKIFTEKTSNKFFEYQFLNDGQLVKITFSDRDIKYADYADVEKDSSSVFKADSSERSITYHVKKDSFFFFNWLFAKN